MLFVFLRAGAVALVSMLISVAVGYVVLPLRGTPMDGTSLLMCVLCPLAIAFPASCYSIMQKRRLNGVLADLSRVHAELAEAHVALGEKARRDAMTGLLTREAFFQALSETRPSPSGGLIVVALRNTRVINERHGFRTGDEALLQMADALHRACGGADLMARLSDNEVAVYLSETDPASLLSARERIHWEISRACLASDTNDPVPLVVAVATTMAGHGSNVESLLRRTEQGLVESPPKARGLTKPIAA